MTKRSAVELEEQLNIPDEVETFSLNSDSGDESESEYDFGVNPYREPGENETVVERNGDYEDDDCSSDEEQIRNRVGNIPMEWYDDHDHIGYDIHGHRVGKTKKEGDELDKLLDRMDNPDFWRTVHNKTEGTDIVLSNDDLAIIDKIRGSKYPDLGYNPYEPYVDFFSFEKMETPLVDTPEPKRRFVPSKWEHKKVMKIIRAIRNGWIKPKEDTGPKRPVFYDLWGSSSGESSKNNPMHIPAPKLQLPGNEESYNPPEEYLPTPEERDEWEQTDPEDRSRNYLSQKYPCLRHVPAYPTLINEKFKRCLDLYLCPRKMKRKISMNPDELLPKLPKPKDLKPFPTTQAVRFSGHEGHVYTTDTSPSGFFVVSGGEDRTVRIWESTTGRELSRLALPDTVTCVTWNKAHSMIAVAAGDTVFFINPGQGDRLKVEDSNKMLLRLTEIKELPTCTWYPLGSGDPKGPRLKITHGHVVRHVTWHNNGNYLAVVMEDAPSCPVLIHNLPKLSSQKPFNKSRGIIQKVEFHPSRPFFFVLSQRYVRVYNLVKQAMVKKLMCSVKWASSMAIHPRGDNLIVGSYDKTLVWLDMDLSVKPYKSLQQHKKAIRDVVFHPRYPLYATASDDNTVIVTHATVYNDLVRNPLIVPVKVLRGHKPGSKYGMLSVVFHPHLPWVYSGGADGDIWLHV